MFQFKNVFRALIMISVCYTAPLLGAQNQLPGSSRPPRPATPPPSALVRPDAPGVGVSAASPAIPSAAIPPASRPASRSLPVPTATTSTKSPIIVLSIDGAAVRGIAQFALLQAIETSVNTEIRKLGDQAAVMKINPTDKTFPLLKITDIFDFFAGTSAGSINVGAILIPKDPLRSNTDGAKVEPKYSLSELKEKLPATLKAAFAGTDLRKIRTLGGLLGSKFTAKPLEDLLRDYTGTQYSDVGGTLQVTETVSSELRKPDANKIIIEPRMSEPVKPAVLTSYDLIASEVMNSSTYDACTPAKNDPTNPKPTDEQVFYLPKDKVTGFVWKDTNLKLWEAMRASSAAPVYYKPLEMKIRGRTRALIDAGLFVMSPTLLAWLEVQRLYPNRPMVIISISSGTLSGVREVDTKGATAGSIPKVLQPTIETALEGQQALTHIMMQELPNIEYHRLGFAVKSKKFDDVSDENVKALEDAAQKTAASPEFNKAIQSIVSALISRKTRLKTNPNDFKPFICQIKEEQRKNMAGILHAKEVLATIETVKQYRAKRHGMPRELQEKVEAIKSRCQSIPPRSMEYQDMKCNIAVPELR